MAAGGKTRLEVLRLRQDKPVFAQDELFINKKAAARGLRLFDRGEN
jgi:hypothetical protein